MKIKLTKEQSQHLISLGVPKEKAHDKISYGFLGYEPIFQFTDLFDILPKEIKTKDNIYWQTILWSGTSYFVGYRNHNTDRWLYQICLKQELIDALYELCIWYIKNKHLIFIN